MAISIDWPTGVITIPKADTTLVSSSPNEQRELDLEAFHKSLRILYDSEDGRSGFPRTHDYSSPTTLSGIDYALQLNVRSEYYTVTFENGSYRVDLVGGNSNIADVLNLNSVQVVPQNSAGLVSLADIKRTLSALNDTVYFDSINGVSGTTVGIGLPDQKSNNLADALTISARDSIKKIDTSSNLTLSEDMTGFSVRTTGTSNYLTLTGTDTNGLSAEDLIVTGTQKGFAVFNRCTVGLLTGAVGQMRQCGLMGSIGMAGDPLNAIRFVDCFESDPTAAHPVLDFSAGTTTGGTIQRYSGKLEIKGVNASGKRVEVNLLGGQLTINSDCTAGTIVLSGMGGPLVNNGTVTLDSANYIQMGFANSDRTQLKEVWQRNALDASNPVTRVKAGDDVTESFDDVTITHDSNGSTTVTSTRS